MMRHYLIFITSIAALFSIGICDNTSMSHLYVPWHRSPIRLLDYDKKELFFDRVVYLTLNVNNYTGDGRISKHVATGVLIDKQRVLTAFNAFRNMTKTGDLLDLIYLCYAKSRRVELPFKTFYDYQCTKVVCGRPIIPMDDDELDEDQWHGRDKKHSPVHDLMVLRLETELDVWAPEYEEPYEIRHSAENIKNNVNKRCGPLLTQLCTVQDKLSKNVKFVSLGLTKDKIKRFFGLELGEYEDAENVVLDCDEWLPRNWGYFFCLANDDNRFGGFSSGALLFAEKKLFGVGSFAIWRGRESILVFTDIRPYLTHIENTCTKRDLY